MGWTSSFLEITETSMAKHLIQVLLDGKDIYCIKYIIISFLTSRKTKL